MAGAPANRAGPRFRDGARLVPTTAGRETVAPSLRVATPVLGLEERRANGVAKPPRPACVAVPVTDEPVRTAALLPGTRGDQPGQAPAIGQTLRGRSRVPSDADAVVDAVVIARPETNGRAIVPRVGVTTSSRACVKDVAPTPPELRIATSGMG